MSVADVCMDLRKDDTHKSVMQFNSISETYLLLCTSVAVAQICCHADVTQFMCNMHKSRSVFRRFWRSENKHGSGAVIQITLEVLVSSKRWWFWTGPNPDHCQGTELCVPALSCSHSTLPGLWFGFQTIAAFGILTDFGSAVVRQFHQIGLDF